MTEEEFRRIIRRFKDSDLYHHLSNKENQNTTQSNSRDHSLSKQEITRLNRNISTLEAFVQSLMNDANKVFRYYEQVILESTVQFDILKDEFTNLRQSAADQKSELENIVSQLGRKVQVLNEELIDRQSLYNQLLQKYQLAQQKASQVHIEQRKIVKQIHLQLIRQSSHNENVLVDIIRQNDQLKAKLFESVKMREELQDQNSFLKNTNEELAQSVEILKNKLSSQYVIEYETENGCMAQFQKCDVGTISRVKEDLFTLEEIRMNDSQELNRSREKEILNISEHYSKFNRTQEFQSKEKQNYEFADSHQGISFVRSRFIAQQSKPPLFKINTNESKAETKDKQSSSGREITEIKQFQVSDSPFVQKPQINPYHAFFLLLTQCQKMNSPHFQRISHLDVNHLYPSLISRFVPFNLWQHQIRKILDSYTK